MKLTDFFSKTEIRRNREHEEFHIYLKKSLNSLKYSKKENSRPRQFYWCMLLHIFLAKNNTNFAQFLPQNIWTISQLIL